MSGYSKVTDNKVKNTLKAMGVSMSSKPVSTRNPRFPSVPFAPIAGPFFPSFFAFGVIVVCPPHSGSAAPRVTLRLWPDTSTRATCLSPQVECEAQVPEQGDEACRHEDEGQGTHGGRARKPVVRQAQRAHDLARPNRYRYPSEEPWVRSAERDREPEEE